MIVYFVLLLIMAAIKKSFSKRSLYVPDVNDRKDQLTKIKGKSNDDLISIQDKSKMFEKYKIGHVISTGTECYLGTYGEVRKCLFLGNNKVRAIKIINKSDISELNDIIVMKQLMELKDIVFILSGSSKCCKNIRILSGL